MTQNLYTFVALFVTSFIIALAGYPLLIRLSAKLNFTDKPNARKVHKQPVPVVGGIGIIATLALLSLLFPELRHTLTANYAVSVSLLVLAITGVLDDRFDISAKVRLLIQLTAAYAVAHSGIRITTFHGYMGINEIPVGFQYAFTIILIAGVTNAVNLVDGIDGLAGSLALTNIGVLTIASFILGETGIAMLLLAVAGALLAFLRYNWRPARIFMGDGGSLFLGFLMSVTGIYLTEVPAVNSVVQDELPVVLVACFAFPVVDALRVFAGRMQKGRSPFAADKTHMHHKLIQHFLLHNSATRRILMLHMSLIVGALVLHRFISMSMISVMLLVFIMLYSLYLDFAQNFSVWYRKIRHYEDS